MAAGEIPDSVRRLVTRCINTVTELEAVLLLRQKPERDWMVDEAARLLFVSEAVAANALSALANMGFFTSRDGKYRYDPATVELRQSVDELADTYSHQLIALTNLIHSKPPSSVRQFADAFRIRKDK